jgi:hypothetical protein
LGYPAAERVARRNDRLVGVAARLDVLRVARRLFGNKAQQEALRRLEGALAPQVLVEAERASMALLLGWEQRPPLGDDSARECGISKQRGEACILFTHLSMRAVQSCSPLTPRSALAAATCTFSSERLMAACTIASQAGSPLEESASELALASMTPQAARSTIAPPIMRKVLRGTRSSAEKICRALVQQADMRGFCGKTDL